MTAPLSIAADPTGHAPPHHLGALTGVRFVAAVHVVLFHTTWYQVPRLPTPLANVMFSASASVGMFFILSGFVLAHNYGRTELADRAGFWWARVARVYPAYLLALLVALPLWLRALFNDHGGQIPLGHVATILFADVALLQSWVPRIACELNCPAWSVSTEAFFYLLFPLLLALLLRCSRRGLLAAAALACGVSLALLALWLTRYSTRVADVRLVLLYSPLARLPEFVLGVALGLWFGRAPRLRHAGTLSVLVTVLLLALLMLPVSPAFAMERHFAYAPLFALLVLLLAYGDGPVARALATPTMVRLGEASYPLYLLHLPLWEYLRALVGEPVPTPGDPAALARWVGFLALYWAIITGASLAVVRWYETPARRAIRAWVSARRARRAAPDERGLTSSSA